MTTAAERKYVLTRIKAGDYLLPSNDGRTIWRLSQYEDGPSHGLDWPKDRQVWGCWRWVGGTIRPGIDVEDWSSWEMVASTLATRKEAISEALRITKP